MVVVSAFGVLNGTQNAGMTAYYRAPGCTTLTIADALPILSKIKHYENEYIIGEMLVWDSGVQSGSPNNCVMVNVIIYNDGWICAWFEKTTQNQLSLGGAQYVSATILSGWGTSLDYEDKYNGFILKITGSTDPNCPVGTYFTILNTDTVNGQISVRANGANPSSFHSGYTYSTDIYPTNGNMIWWGVSSNVTAYPPYKSNRLYRALYQLWADLKYNSNSTDLALGNASKVYCYNSPYDAYNDYTTPFNNYDPSDVYPLYNPISLNNTMYVGSSNKFEGVHIDMGINGVGIETTWEYYDGSTWVVLPCTDGTAGFTTDGSVTYTPPLDWEKDTVNGYMYYWIRGRCTTASYTTVPRITRGQLYIQDNIDYEDNELGVYNFEYTSANYCLLCGRCDSKTPTPYLSYFYTTVLPGKTIYDHVLHSGMDNNAGASRVYFNGHYIYKFDNVRTCGYENYDVTDIDHAPGTQDVITLYAPQTGSRNKTATVLLVS